MTKEDAIRIAQDAVNEADIPVKSQTPNVRFQERHMALGKNLSGWVVRFLYDFPEGFESKEVYVEVYEPEGTVNICRII